MSKNWIHTLLPITAWLPNYGSYHKMFSLACFRPDAHKDVRWLSGDVITGLTVAIVNIPQALSYASVSQRTTRLVLEKLADWHAAGRSACRIRTLLLVHRNHYLSRGLPTHAHPSEFLPFTPM